MFRIINTQSPILRCRFPTITQQCGLKQSVEERLGLPEKPKKPCSAFVKFIGNSRPDILMKNPSIKQKDVFRIASQLWKNCPDATKKGMQEEYQKEYGRYTIELEKYNNSLSTKQKEEIQEAIEEIKDQKEKREIRLANAKRNKELGKPVRPLTSYLLFTQSEQHNRGKRSVSEFQSELGEKWASLSQSQKQKFVLEAAKLKEAYEKSLDIWEKKMIAQGNLDVVRNKTLEESLASK